ncbi:MAG: 2-C-methyl-D-erythritol 4-phosphate cytidylyltransferase [Muribaculaceae bacterium]|nr:2-C-methyl-D-erythritol 4-phosphate cytidylyltransferase [Muribaculaceae bacterium]
MKFSVIITAGGTSSRFGGTNKLLEKINGKEVIKYTIEAFLNCGIDEIIICANESVITDFKGIFKDEKIKIINGGDSRQASVYNGLQVANCDYVLIHDGARPLIQPEIIKNVMRDVVEKKAVSVMTKTIDTIKEVDENGRIIKTIDRSKLFNTQTPQAFEYNLIKDVHQKLHGQNYTDDAGMVEALGYDVYMVEGDYKNIKVTTKSDIALCEVYLKG